ncbi:hypothetical protein IJJ08_00855 [bacterium]|nr:hypothetical protein [bacterium]
MPSEYTNFCQQFINALTDAHDNPVILGCLPEIHFKEINAIRESSKIPAIAHNTLVIYPRVCQKLYHKRLNQDRYLLTQLASIAASCLFDPESRATSTRFRHIQALVKTNDDHKTANVVYLSEYKGKISLKSVYINYLKDIIKQSLEGGG